MKREPFANGRRPGHAVTIGRTRETRGPDALERGFVALVIAAMMLIAVVFGGRLVHMVQSLDAVSLAWAPRNESILYYAEHGRWPRANDPNALKPGTSGRYVERMELADDGVVTTRLRLGPTRGVPESRVALEETVRRGSLSFRPELLGSRALPSFSWLCGYARPAAGGVAVGEDRTTLDPRDLPPFCR